MLMIIAGAVALVLMQQRPSPPAPRVYGPERYASARVAETNSGEGGEFESVENVTEPMERVPNPRKVNSDVEQTTEVETRRVPDTHIVGFRWNRSDESRTRLLARQHKEMTQHTLHQYE
jgi:hypothetical protein